jgi:hypothetical protein
MSTKIKLRKFIHDLSNKVMILEGYLSIVRIKPEFDVREIISKLEENVTSVAEIVENMREHVRQDSEESGLVALVYISEIKDYITDIELESELSKIQISSYSNNKDNDITGYLLYMDGYFIQYIEGSPENVEKLYLQISLDPRHSSITLLSHEKIAKRAFKKWDKLYRMDHHNQSQIPDVLKSIVGEKQRLLSKTESLSLVNFVSWLSEKD